MSGTDRGNAASSTSKAVKTAAKDVGKAAKAVKSAVTKSKPKTKTTTTDTVASPSVPSAQAVASSIAQPKANTPSPPSSSPVPSPKSGTPKSTPLPSISESPKVAPSQLASSESGKSTVSTLTKAKNVLVPGGRTTPDGRLRKSILVCAIEYHGVRVRIYSYALYRLESIISGVLASVH